MQREPAGRRTLVPALNITTLDEGDYRDLVELCEFAGVVAVNDRPYAIAGEICYFPIRIVERISNHLHFDVVIGGSTLRS